MSFKLFIFSASLLAVAGCVNAASVRIHNTNDGEDAIYGLFNEQGVLLPAATAGNVRIGTFADGFDVGQAWNSGNVSALEGNFLQFGQNGSLYDTIDGHIHSLFTSTNASFTDKQIVLWISDSADFLNPSGQHLIFQFDASFNTATTSNQVMALRPDAGDLLVGGFGKFSHDYGFGGGALQGFNLTTVVPEPSTYALLIGLTIAAITVVRRRRA